jgi:type IV pilus assembly protein PilB
VEKPVAETSEEEPAPVLDNHQEDFHGPVEVHLMLGQEELEDLMSRDESTLSPEEKRAVERERLRQEAREEHLKALKKMEEAEAAKRERYRKAKAEREARAMAIMSGSGDKDSEEERTPEDPPPEEPREDSGDQDADKLVAEEQAKREEEERLSKEKAEQEEAERKEAEEQAKREEEERLAKEKAAKEEAERKQAEEQAKREEEERLAKEKAEQEEAERKEAERKEAEEQAKREEEERLAKEQAEKEEAERKEAEEQAKREEVDRERNLDGFYIPSNLFAEPGSKFVGPPCGTAPEPPTDEASEPDFYGPPQPQEGSLADTMFAPLEPELPPDPEIEQELVDLEQELEEAEPEFVGAAGVEESDIAGKTSRADFVAKTLLDRKIVTRKQLEMAIRTQDSQRIPLTKAVVELGFAEEGLLLRTLAAAKGVAPWDFTKEDADDRAVRKVPGHVCRQLQVLPVRLKGDLLTVAMRDPGDSAAIRSIRELAKVRIEPALADELRLATAIEVNYASQRQQSLQVNDDLVEQAMKDTVNRDDKDKRLAVLSEEDTRPVVGLVNKILSKAIQMGASDVHIEPGREAIVVRLRVDGMLIKAQELPMKIYPMIVTRLKIMSELDIVEFRMPQDGRITVQEEGRKVDLRVSILPNYHGSRIVMRILDRSASVKDLDSLGFTRSNLQTFRKIIDRPYGLFIVTGPTGSGKTTTLYAGLNEVKNERVNIMTCEDPVEYDVEGINQSQVNEKVGLTFAKQLRAILRQDPDVILVGEIRDQETAQTAIRAALTGHLVLSTVHANDAPSAVPRLLDMGVDPYLLSSSLIGTMAQRLVRQICPHCKTWRKPDELEKETLDLFGINMKKIADADGCDKCFNTGYQGRVAVHEILPITKKLSRLVSAQSSVEELAEAASTDGRYRAMCLDAMDRVQAGQISLKEARRLIDFDAIEEAAAAATDLQVEEGGAPKPRKRAA